MTTRPDSGGQLDLFGNPVAGAPSNVMPLVESNDVDLLLTVAANAIHCGYLLAGPSERVYARDSDQPEEVVRVPRYEDDAVHQLLYRRWLSRGTPRHVTCGAVALFATTVLVPKDTRHWVARWQHRQRPPNLPHTPAGSGGPAANTPGWVTRLDDYRRTR
jgi:hypothetical protein